MALQRADSIGDSCTTEGTGTISLLGVAPQGHLPIVGNITDGATIRVRIFNYDPLDPTQTNTDWEVVEGVYTAAGQTLTRVTVYESSTGGATVVFAAGTKAVVVVVTAADFLVAFTGTTITPTGYVDATGSDGNFYRLVAAQAQVATPTFSPVAGNYGSAQSVSISCATAGAAIYYTTNGSTPTTGSTAYTGAFSVSVASTVKAIAAKTGYANSAVGSAAYTFTDVDAAAWATAVTSAGGTYSAGTLAALSTFITAAKANGYWSDLYLFGPCAGNQRVAGLIQYVNGSWASATGVNLVDADYTEATGFTGNGTNKAINTGVAASTFAANNRHISIYERSHPTGTGKTSIGMEQTFNTQRWGLGIPATVNGDYIYYASSTNTGPKVTGNSAGGHYVGSGSDTNPIIYKNGSSVATLSVTAATPDSGSVWVMAMNRGGYADGADCVCAEYSAGNLLSGTKVGNFYTNLQAFQTALGRQV